ncbi:MAG: RNA methyltransferase [Candidatus Lambdaproteobacteria bacterium RIFOXYD12_FULL_49_8]|uniref:RNA methyltransferase n=1 Tax=Candidatus Lambdaproteobacteria bacterium RIFOXYD2_FULL_50_16 TaxID=1817772 RepID=A0A1F6G7L3_9PROT|nr:MAG: RNA methyltransferase [Candidatus Lambdaproteobacteria bacterium RIFOXYD2_FULL_50_16]OGG96140.1 MAG: RNA methyltransferase [Candidatus Lambdaproteobacteria bacterium RIFOXYD12_FULL_49_8]
MAYDEGLAARIEELLGERPGFSFKRMFGGLCFLLNGNMLCGVVGEELMLRVGPDQYEATLARPGAKEMDFTGRPLKGMIYVNNPYFEETEDLKSWLEIALQFVVLLPPKKAKL